MTPSIPPEIFSFLNELEKNNTREWFSANKARFKAIEAEMKIVNQALYMAMQKHDEIDKMKMFRIYRDVRFSKDKTPYKTHFGCSFHRKKPELRGGYYLQIGPGASFLATGFWNPEKEDLLRIRKELALDADEFRAIIGDSKFVKTWGQLQGDELKTAPKGFSKEHKDIDLIRKKQFIFTKTYTDQEVVSADFLVQVTRAFKDVRPYFDYMSDVLTTDLNGVSLL